MYQDYLKNDMLILCKPGPLSFLKAYQTSNEQGFSYRFNYDMNNHTPYHHKP